MNAELLDMTAFPLAAMMVTLAAGYYAHKAFTAWLDFKKLQLAALGQPHSHGPAHDYDVRPDTSGVIEIADLKERVRKLEAIAEGIDL